jgi:hypothetical protein
MFNFSRQSHVCAPHPIPKHAPLYFTFDWGFGAPFSCGWCYIDADGRIFRFGEWYGWTGTPNQGLRLADSQIAEGIISKEMEMGIRTKSGGLMVDGFDCGRPSRKVTYILSPDCFSRKPDYKGGGQGPSTSEVFARYGLHSTPGDATRDQKIKQFHERLRLPRDESVAPMFQIFDSCTQFIRTVPLLQQDQHNPEDVDTKLEDHIYDEQALLFMARPLSLELPPEAMTSYDRRIDELKRGEDDKYTRVATIAAEREMQAFEGDEWEHLEGADYDDGNRDLISTMD